MIIRIIALLSLAAVCLSAQAQKWPDRPIRTLVPFAPGGSIDVITRVISQHLVEEFGQQFVLDNRGGAGGTIAAEITARARPDGYTIIFGSSTYATGAALYKLPYDPVKDIAPIGLVNVGPLVLTVNPGTRAANVREFIELLRAKPNGLTFGSPGTGTGGHLAGGLFMQMTGTRMIHVPYKGDGPAVQDVAAGQIQVTMAGGTIVMPLVKAGKLRALAITSEKRWPTLPDLPTVNESVPGYQYMAWHGIWGPAGLPKDIITRFNQALGRILKMPDVEERFRAAGREPQYSTPEEFGRIIARDIAKWQKVIKSADIKPD
jgi:tripartite-type tricarboxylate transporter receptor subunit TctC